MTLFCGKALRMARLFEILCVATTQAAFVGGGVALVALIGIAIHIAYAATFAQQIHAFVAVDSHLRHGIACVAEFFAEFTDHADHIVSAGPRSQRARVCKQPTNSQKQAKRGELEQRQQRDRTHTCSYKPQGFSMLYFFLWLSDVVLLH